MPGAVVLVDLKGSALGEFHRPLPLVDCVVVTATERYRIAEIGDPTLFPLASREIVSGGTGCPLQVSRIDVA